ncbi:hypothetical protein [Methylobacterium haplocladii]|uniref:Uncharacterized protein n=1 Tax=Methylobacterium haplocladii TaxID=1176176 RepID=A0A512ISE1_9HYPH|nr:hypothetical protein [Methylobacterium haplocladii]GEP00624.1 hypothetical protein MHA02_30110 [Methylobacterium haplocladii]GJD85539.1 hypothetical protein HPGCJGGD_3428 [Methylobacterium haplocladii]GLS57772.1 hypothetical protein GCM10007887_04280 [Methylobacterium haplocladii]
MAVGDADDMLARLRTLLPPWFPDEAPILDGLLGGIAALLAFVHGLIAYAKAQTRIATATGGWLDLIAFDFFGLRFLRRAAETDDAFRPRILRELLRPRATREAIRRALVDLTGREPVLQELWNPGDCGGYGIGAIAYAGSGTGEQPVSGYGDNPSAYGIGTFAYVVPAPSQMVSGGAGAWGSLAYPYQTFITAFRPATAGIPELSGYGSPGGGYGVGVIAYADLSQSEAQVTDAEIYATIAATVAAGTIGWTAIQS